MGAIMPVLSTLATVAGAVTTAKGAVQTLRNAGHGWGDSASAEQRALRAQHEQTLSQLKAQQKLSQTQAEENAAQERTRLAAETSALEETRRAALRRAVAAQRARFGAQGIAPEGGSADAVLLGLFQESDAERARRDQIDGLRTAALASDLGQRRSVNLLQSTQLAQRQALERSLAKWA